jgi:hypothetical protein
MEQINNRIAFDWFVPSSITRESGSLESCKQTHFSSLILCLCLTGPPKALDEDETEFLDSLEMYKKQQEQELAQEEARELTGFHAAIASRTITAEEPRQLVPTTASTHETVPGRGKRLSQASVVTSLIRIKSHPKRAKVESLPKEGSNQVLPVQKVDGQQMLGLVSYPDESDEEEQTQ